MGLYKLHKKLFENYSTFVQHLFPKTLDFLTQVWYTLIVRWGERNACHLPVRQTEAKPFKPQGAELVQAEQYRRPALRVAEVKARLLGERGKP